MQLRAIVRAFLIVAAVIGVSTASELDHSSAVRTSGGLGRPLPAGWHPAVMDNELHTFTAIQRAEFRSGNTPDAAVLDTEGWVGGDYQRFWWKAEAEQLIDRPKSGEFELQALYGKMISPFWDVQAGVRFDRAYSGPERDSTGYVVVGLEGLAPYRFEVEPSVALSDRGNLSFTLSTSYDLLVTQRIILQPRLDLRLDTAEERDSSSFIGEGLNDLDIGIRLRYDIRRNFSPYVGVEWHRPLGASSSVARRAGIGGWRSAFVIGVRGWF